MKTRKILHDALDIDHGLIQTFLALFSDPKKVVAHPDQFTGPWKYATYVVSISCLLTWFFIHLIVDPEEQDVLWNVPKRVAELTNGYASFYENIQPLKRLLIHSIATYFALSLLLYKKRKSSSFLVASLYLIGHSVFLQFIFQAIGILILRQSMLSEGNVMPTIGFITNVAWLLYALLKIYGQDWIHRLVIPVVITVEMIIYGFTSTRLQHFLYYSIFNRDRLHFTLKKSAERDLKSFALTRVDSSLRDFKDVSFISLSSSRSTKHGSGPNAGYHIVGEYALNDSVWLVADGEVPTGNEISKISLQGFAPAYRSAQWTTAIFEKANRYSPDAAETFLIPDSLTKVMFACFRIPNDSNATVRIASVDFDTGGLNFNNSLELQGDDLHIYGMAIDATSVYLCGSALDILNNIELGIILKVDKSGGHLQNVSYWGDQSFHASTKFKGIKVRDGKIKALVKHDYRRLFLFHESETSVLTIPE